MTTLLSLAMAFGVILSTGTTASANALAGGGYSSSYAGESVFEGKAASESGQFSAIFFNDGTQSWAPGVVGLLICLSDKVTCNVTSPNASYASGWYSSTVYATVSSTVAPGQNGFFIYDFAVPAGTPSNTVATFNGDVGIIATGAELRPEGYYQQNTTPAAAGALTISPTSASLGISGQQQFTATTNLTGTVGWSVTGGCGAITAQGLFVATAMNSSSQPCSVVASIGSLTASAPITVFGTPSSLSCNANPSSIVVGGGANGTSSVTIAVKDSNGNTVANSSLAISVTNATPTLATVAPTGTITASSGTATLTVTSTTVTGQILISAASTSTINGCTVSITSGSAGTPTKTASSFTVNPIAADNTSTTTLRVDVEDVNGSRVIADTGTVITVSTANINLCSVTGVVTGTAGSYSGGTGTATDVQGRVEFTVKSTTVPGSCAFTATPSNTSISASTATLTTQIVGYANKLAVTANDSPHAAGSSSTTTVTVVVQDALGDQVTSSTATITATADTSSCTGAGGGSVLPTTKSTTGSGGQAVFTFTSNGAYSGCLITFSSSGLTSATATLVFTAGPADHLSCAFSPDPQLNSTAYYSTGLVYVNDQAGNTVTAGSYSVNLAYSKGDGVTSLITSNPRTTNSGVAAFQVRMSATIGTDTYTPSLASGSLPYATANQTCQIWTVTSF